VRHHKPVIRSSTPFWLPSLAAVAEKPADDAGLRRPSWTAAVPSLASPWEPAARGEHVVAPQFAARRLLVDASSLFREQASPALRARRRR
jgi:hypothetical protein